MTKKLKTQDNTKRKIIKINIPEDTIVFNVTLVEKAGLENVYSTYWFENNKNTKEVFVGD